MGDASSPTALGSYFTLTRPFTLLPPALGMASGAASALGAGAAVAAGPGPWPAWLVPLLLGILMAAVLNAASNVLNQVHDLHQDRINRPERPLPSGAVSVRSAQIFAAVLYALAVALCCFIRPDGSLGVLWLVLPTVFLTWAYSAPPLRLRRSWWAAPLVIAVPRGGLLKVAGWASVAPDWTASEPWALGAVFFLFVLGVSPAKDFADVAGDRAAGCSSLPLRFGAHLAARLMAPFWVLPWLLFAVLAYAGQLGVEPWAGALVGLGLALYGGRSALALMRAPRPLAEGPEGRKAWVGLYRLMMAAQVGVAVLYLVFGVR